MKKIACLIILIGLLCVGNVYGEFIDNNNGTITDTETGLIWQSYESSIISSQDQIEEFLTDSWKLPTYEKIYNIYPYICQKMNNDEIEFFWLSERNSSGKNLTISFEKQKDWVHISETFITKAKILGIWNDDGTLPLCPTCPTCPTCQKENNNFGCFIEILSFAKWSLVLDSKY